MLQRNISIGRNPRGLAPAQPYPRAQADFSGDALMNLLRGLRRNLRLILAVTLIGTFIAAAAVFSMTPLYKATALVLVDPRQTKLLQDAEVVGRPGTESGVIDSETEMITSPAIMRAVAQKLHLDNDDEFADPSGIIGHLKAYTIAPLKKLLGLGASGSDPYGPIVDKLDRYASAKRRALSYVIELNTWSRDAAKAAVLANSFAEQYLAAQVADKEKITEHATRWLNGRVEELRARVHKADEALEHYKAEAGLFDPAGENLSDRQIASLNDQLVDARAKAATARAKYEQLKQITPDKMRSAAATVDVLQSPVISNLRGQYADAARKQAERAARYGPENPIVITGRAEVARLEREISAEIRRIISSAKSESEIAQSREESLEASMDDLKQRATKFNQASIKLHALEREAQANRELLQSFMARAKQTAELSLQLPDSRIISQAATPTGTSYPKRTLIIGVAFFGSLGLGIALALAKDLFGKGFRSSEEIESALGLQPLASIPTIEGSFRRLPRGREPLLGDMQSRRLLPGPRTDAKASSRDQLATAQRLSSLVVDQPDSAFAESIRALRLNIRHADCGTLLVTSALAGEGKSTIAANLAREAALSGERVLLIDADLRHPSIAAALDFSLGEARPTELADILLGEGDFRKSIRRDRKSGLYVIAGTTRVSGAEAAMLLSSKKMRGLVEISRKAFDLVVIDASPLLPIADSRILVDLVDGVVLVVESEQTSREMVAAALRETPALDGKVIGAVLNRTVGNLDRYYYYRDAGRRPAHETA